MKKTLPFLITFTILFSSCMSAKPSWEYKRAPKTLFEAINVKDSKDTKKDKSIMKVLLFTTTTFVLWTLNK